MPMDTSILDIVIIGGGINGSGIAFDAVRRGFNTALFEQHDFGFGASTATSKLAHGGLRYLESYQFKLVRESLNERNFLLKRAPHLVKPLQFYVPLYKHSKWRPWKLKAGLTIYDWIQLNRQLPPHQMLSVNELTNSVPWLIKDDCLGGASYFDAQMEDHRLIIELLLMAQKEGALIQNYSKVVEVNDTPWGYSCSVLLESGKIETVNTKSIISAAGAWSNQFSPIQQVKPSKGTHIILPDMNLNVALLLMSKKDGRVFFMIPWHGKTLVGTTDEFGKFEYNNPQISNHEIDYLLGNVNDFYNGRIWSKSDIEDAFCGFRPLIHTDITQASNQTREDAYTWIKKNMLSVTGGKYTTYRLMSERALNILHKKVFHKKTLLRSYTNQCDFIGKLDIKDWPSASQMDQLSNRYHINRESLIHIIETYGGLYKEILNYIPHNQELSSKLDIEYPMIGAEMKYAISKEWTRKFSDFMLRRSYYGYLHKKDKALIKKAAHQFKQLTNSEESEFEMVESIMNRGVK